MSCFNCGRDEAVIFENDAWVCDSCNWVLDPQPTAVHKGVVVEAIDAEDLVRRFPSLKIVDGNVVTRGRRDA